MKKKNTGEKKLWSKQCTYTTKEGINVLMDSTWEYAFAERLDRLGIKWVRDEKMTLPYQTPRGRKRKYVPDFYLPDYDMYVEVKGYFTESAKHKMADVIQRNNVKIAFVSSMAEVISWEVKKANLL